LIHGFRRYRELFNARPFLHLTLLGKAISTADDEKDKRLLGIAYGEHLSTNKMYVGYAFGSRREVARFAGHSFRHLPRPVELSPWLAGTGRGTFPNVLNKLKRAIRFARCPSDLDPRGGRRRASRQVGPPDGTVGSQPRRGLCGQLRAAIRTQNS